MTPKRAKPSTRPLQFQVEARISVVPEMTLVATGVRLLVDFSGSITPGLAFRTRPERKLLGPIGRKVDLGLGDVAPGAHHALLFKLRAPPHPVGELEVARLEVQYRASGLGDWRQEQHVVLPFGDAQPSEVGRAKKKTPSRPPRRFKSDAQLIADFRRAYHQGRLHHSAEAIEALVERSHDPDRAKQLRAVLTQLRETGRLADSALDTITRSEERHGRYDVLLLDVGERHIKVARIMRELTGLGLREINELLAEQETFIGRGLEFARAAALKESLESAGASVELRRSGSG